MTDEPEYFSTHDQVKEIAAQEFAQTMGGRRVEPVKVYDQQKTTELEDIRRSQKYILDKLSSMDRFLRSTHFRYGNKIMDGDAYEKEVIEKFLSALRDRVATQEQYDLFNNTFTQKPKEIEEDVF